MTATDCSLSQCSPAQHPYILSHCAVQQPVGQVSTSRDFHMIPSQSDRLPTDDPLLDLDETALLATQNQGPRVTQHDTMHTLSSQDSALPDALLSPEANEVWPFANEQERLRQPFAGSDRQSRVQSLKPGIAHARTPRGQVASDAFDAFAHLPSVCLCLTRS